MTMFNAFHAIAAARGDGLLPEFLGLRPPQAMVVSIDDLRANADATAKQDQPSPAAPAAARTRPNLRALEGARSTARHI